MGATHYFCATIICTESEGFRLNQKIVKDSEEKVSCK